MDRKKEANRNQTSNDTHVLENADKINRNQVYLNKWSNKRTSIEKIQSEAAPLKPKCLYIDGKLVPQKKKKIHFLINAPSKRALGHHKYSCQLKITTSILIS